MTVSFTGINNVYVGKKQVKKFSTYLSNTNELKQGECTYKSVRIKCNLTDDSKGKDLTEFKTALKKSDTQAKYINKENPNTIDLMVTNKEANDGIIGKSSTSMIKLNGEDVTLTDRKELPLFTYLAKLTRQLTNSPEVSNNQKVCTNMANEGIHNNAIDFIENM